MHIDEKKRKRWLKSLKSIKFGLRSTKRGGLFILLPYFGGQFVQMVGSERGVSGDDLNEAIWL